MAILFGLFALLVSLPHTPLFSLKTSIDQAVYQYVGNRILEGQVPYSDAWDHKQPLIYFIYAAASFLTAKSTWGIWLIEFLCLWASGVLSYLLLVKFCPPIASAICVVVNLFAVNSFVGISIPEQLALPLYLLSIIFFYQFIRSKPDSKAAKLYSYGMGMTFACCFFLKQSLISVALAIGIYFIASIILKKKWLLLLHLIYIGAGFLFISAIMLGYLGLHHALQDYWNAAFLFNFIYAGTGLLERVQSALDQLEIISAIPSFITAFGLWLGMLAGFLFTTLPGILNGLKNRSVRIALIVCGAGIILLLLIYQRLTQDPSLGILQTSGLILGLVVAVTGILATLFRKKIENLCFPTIDQLRQSLRSYHGLFEITILLFPLVLFFISISGEHYYYYNITFYPAVILTFGIVISSISKILTEKHHILMFNISLFGLALAFCFIPIIAMVEQYKTRPENELKEAVNYISQATSADDRIYVWGMEPWIYNSTDRQAPTRYFYQIAAVNWDDYEHKFSVLDEIKSAFLADPPRLFIVSDGIDLGRNERDCLINAEETGNKNTLLTTVCQDYAFDQSFGNIQVYKLKE